MASVPPRYFDALYAQDSDPWNFTGSEYEKQKYAATMEALPRQRYESALEVGCSIGVLTSVISERCTDLIAVDVAEAALSQARERNAGKGHIRFERAVFPSEMPADLPPAGFDLILLSEVLYYLDKPTLKAAARRTVDLSQPGADILLVHWLGPTPDYPLTGDVAADGFISALGRDASLISQKRFAQYRIDLLQI